MFSETTELRTIIEPAAAALAAERATPDQVRIILEAAYAMHPEGDDLQTLFASDCQFHVTVLDATGNDVLRQMRQIIVTMLRICCEFGVIIVDGENVNREGHIEVAEAIKRPRPKVAQSVMARMLAYRTSIATDYWAKV